MSMECGCACNIGDYESVDCHDVQKVTARKRHKCCECGAFIEPGQFYERAKGLWYDGRFTARTCIPCSRIARDYCCGHGGLRETLWEILGMDYVTGEMQDEE